MKNYFDFEIIKRGLKNPKVKSAVVLSAGLVILLFVFWFVGLFRTPPYYRPVKFIADGNMSQYLTNYILPELNNKSQYGQPFDLVISETGINDIIVRHIDADSLQQANLSDLSVAFRRGRILLTGKTVYYGIDFIVTLVLKPYIDKEGYFLLKESQIEAGRSRIPFAGEAVKRKVLEGLVRFINNLGIGDFNEASLNNRRIEPVFSLNHRRHRIEKITVGDKELIIHFLPQLDR
jgi:hypothetical protein